MKNISLINARLYDPINGFLPADSLIIKKNRIAWLGNWKDKPDFDFGKSDVIDIQRKVVLPAFIDTHTHFFEYARRKVAINLETAESMDDIELILIQFRENHPVLPKWVRGSGWNINIYPDPHRMDRCFLDRVFPDVPVSFESKDFHSKWCNSLALKIAGIDRDTPNPTGGYIHHFPDGTPNGILSELAWDLIDRVIPSMTKSEMKQVAHSAIEDAWQFGLAGIHSMESSETFSIYNALDDEGIPFRVCWHFPSTELDRIIESGIQSYTGTDTLKIGGMKIFMDGSIGSQTASMFDPYPGGNDYYGHLNMPSDKLATIVERGAKHGISSSIHAIGDRCVHEVIDVIDSVNKKHGIMNHRIEHLQCIRKSDIPKLIKNRVYCSMQPVHMRTDLPLLEKYWSETARSGAYAFATLIQAGLEPGFGSDTPVETLNPFQGIFSALERKHLNKPENPSWHSQERIDTTTAIKCYTVWAAAATQDQDKRGRIQQDMLADLIVIGDFSQEDNTFWLQCESHLTMVDGVIAYSL